MVFDQPIGESPSVMSGNGFYGEHTEGARAVVEAAASLVQEAASTVPIPLGRPIVIADYGAADGVNSAAMVSSMIHGVRDRAPGSPIQVVHTDQPDNDYRALFRWLHGPPSPVLPNSYVNEFTDVFASAVGNSFYHQIFPVGTVDLAFSATAMHWLSRAPKTIPDHLHAVFGSGSVMDAFRDQAREDWETLLLHRASELAPGGKLIVANLCVDVRGRYVGSTGQVNMLDTLHQVWRSLRNDGWISKLEYAAATFPQYYRTLTELEAPLQDPTSQVRRAGMRLLRSFTNVVECPHAMAYARHRDPASFADAYVASLRAWSEGVFLGALDQVRQLPERQKVVDELYGRYRRLAYLRPEEHRLDYVHGYLLLERVKEGSHDGWSDRRRSIAIDTRNSKEESHNLV